MSSIRSLACPSTVLAALMMAAQAFAQTPAPAGSDSPMKTALLDQYNAVKQNVTESAEKMSEADYAFRPVETVRTFGQFVGHIADANLSYCALASGEKPAMTTSAEKLATKAELVAALAKAFAFCDGIYNGMTDQKAMTLVKAGRSDMPAAAILFRNVSHTNEHYGNLVTYMRIKGLVPPTSERN